VKCTGIGNKPLKGATVTVSPMITVPEPPMTTLP
jgi:hypothetical protein